MRLERSGPWIGAVGLLFVLWLIVSTVLFAPWWGVLVHLVVLAAFARVLVRRARTSPESCVWIPGLAFLAWCAVNAIGVLAFGWSF